MEIITVNKENLEKEHICCAISSNKDCQVASKKSWLAERFDDGLIFKKGDVRGKCFIEYIPAEKAWVPIDAPGYMYIDCLWVSGQFKGHGYSNLLLEECVKDAKALGMKGIVALSSPKKKPFLSDPSFLRHKGFLLADTAEPYFELLYLPFEGNTPKDNKTVARTSKDNTAANTTAEVRTDLPRFRPQAKAPHIDAPGYVLYYSHQCPFTAKYVPILEEVAKAKGLPFRPIEIQTLDQAQNAPSAYTAYSLFHDGQFVTHEIQSGKTGWGSANA